MKPGILLEVGTNELEIIEMTIDEVYYGVNVAKVKEIVFPAPLVDVPKMHKSIEGIFDFRGSIIPVVNLKNYLKGKPIEQLKTDKFIIMEFNQLLSAFRVDTVHRIRKISWNAIETPGEMISAENSSITGVVKLLDDETGKEKIIMMLDFEKIVAEIEPATSFKEVKLEVKPIVDRRHKKILISEDSKMVRTTILKSLNAAGYEHVIATKNGLEAWNILKNMAVDNLDNRGWSIMHEFDILITDIEMPQLDGHALVKKIKSDDVLKELPVVIFSSLANEETVKKGKSVGADEQVPKPQIDQLIKTVDKLVS